MKKLVNSKYFLPIFMIVMVVIMQLIFYKIAVKFQGSSINVMMDIDDKIPFNEIAIIPYTLWYILLFTVPFLIYKNDKKEFIKYLTTCFVMNTVADIIFIILPTTVTRPSLICDNILCSMTKIVYFIDTPIRNCFPSLHCSTAIIWILFMCSKKYDNKYRIPVIIISLLVPISTLIIKQHAFIDVIGGISYGFLIYSVINIFTKLQDYLYRNIPLK